VRHFSIGETFCNDSDKPLAPITSIEFLDQVYNKAATKRDCHVAGLHSVRWCKIVWVNINMRALVYRPTV
jgi:hypothetical protein